MRVYPDPPKLFGVPSSINLVVKEIGDGSIVKGDRDVGAGLLDQDDVLHEFWIVRFRNSKTTDLGRPAITQVNQLGPGIRAEP